MSIVVCDSSAVCSVQCAVHGTLIHAVCAVCAAVCGNVRGSVRLSSCANTTCVTPLAVITTHAHYIASRALLIVPPLWFYTHTLTHYILILHNIYIIIY